jgi:crotonobetainyl-CoA:carnitine CoA-transferase CaiB-like acyl-CoA transferase
MSARDSSRPLEGYRVLDFTSMVSGPYCTRLLADMGATVIKVESPDGDLIRHGAPLTSAGSRYFQAFNAGKQSIVLDLKAPDDVRIAADLAAQCDVLVENFRPGVMQKLGLS